MSIVSYVFVVDKEKFANVFPIYSNVNITTINELQIRLLKDNLAGLLHGYSFTETYTKRKHIYSVSNGPEFHHLTRTDA